jgi:hypothetical protein
MHRCPFKIFSLVNLFFFSSGLISYASTFQASLNIVTPIVLSNPTQLDLGRILAANNSETCALGIGGLRTGAACFGSENGDVGVISVAGVDGEIIDITLSGSSFSGMTFMPSLLDNGQGGMEGSGITLKSAHQILIGGTITIDDATIAAAASSVQVDYSLEITYL